MNTKQKIGSKKILQIACMLLFAVLLNFHTADAKKMSGEYGSDIQGNFFYKYEVQKNGTWITEIIPLSSRGISTLKIPEKLGGKKVVKLGSTGGHFYIGDTNTKEPNLNIFGVDDFGDGLIPADVHELVKKIKKIVIPQTVNSIAFNCFADVPDGKEIYIPKGIVQGLEPEGGFTDIKWKKVKIDSGNSAYKVSGGCLLSKSGDKLYGFVQKKKEICIPDGVKTIVWGGNYNGASKLFIPKSIRKIENDVLTTGQSIKIKISSKNRRYAVKNGSVYSKKSGRLVAGYINHGTLDIPDTVKTVYFPGLLGNPAGLKKVIIPNSVKGIAFPHSFLEEREHLTYEFRGTTPPKLLDEMAYSPSAFDGVAIYVPANCRQSYLQKWNAVKIPCKLNIIERKG